jgi:hypothetical protein
MAASHRLGAVARRPAPFRLTDQKRGPKTCGTGTSTWLQSLSKR